MEKGERDGFGLVPPGPVRGRRGIQYGGHPGTGSHLYSPFTPPKDFFAIGMGAVAVWCSGCAAVLGKDTYFANATFIVRIPPPASSRAK